MDIEMEKEELLGEVKKRMARYELSASKPEYYFEPGLMENLEQYYGVFDETKNSILIRTDVKGLRYEGRTQRLENLNVGDSVSIIRESENRYNPNNFMVFNEKKKSLGNLPAELCNVVAPLYDQGFLTIEKATASYIERIRDRSRYAKQGVLFVEILMRLRGI